METATAVGKILLNLQAFEFCLRLLLYESVGPQDAPRDLHQLAVGDCVLENPLTNYDSLGNLVRKVNEQLEALGVPERVDHSLVHLRDALAHGRTTALQPSGPFRLLKFSPAKHGTAATTHKKGR